MSAGLGIDLTKIKRVRLERLHAELVRMQEFGGGYQKMIAEIETELRKKHRLADRK